MRQKDERAQDLVELMNTPLGYSLTQAYNLTRRDELDQGSMPRVSSGRTYYSEEESEEELESRTNKSTKGQIQEEGGSS